jgi:signal transduction histidine kinase
VFRIRAGRSLSSSGPDVARVLLLSRALGLVAVVYVVCISKPYPAAHGRGLAIAITLGLVAIAWIIWMCTYPRRRLMIGMLIVLAAAGGVLAGLTPDSSAPVVSCVVAMTAGAQLTGDISLGITAETVTAFLVTALVSGASAGQLLGYPIGFVGMWTIGLTRRAYLLRAEQAEQTLTEAQRAHAAETKAAALAERARIAREIHDVLAHSLAAVSVNLQAAEGLLGAVPPSPSLDKAIECIGRAQNLTREGMADARRAVLALRADVAPLQDQLASLASVSSDGAVSFCVTGTARPVGAEAGLAAYRTAQEALTNARKHAAGQPVRLELSFSDDSLSVSVANRMPPPDVLGPLAGTGAGYGLTGLRERAALAGGTLEAGPVDGEWRVCLRIPA